MLQNLHPSYIYAWNVAKLEFGRGLPYLLATGQVWPDALSRLLRCHQVSGSSSPPRFAALLLMKNTTYIPRVCLLTATLRNSIDSVR